MKIKEIRELFDSFEQLGSGTDAERINKIIRIVEEERANFEKSEEYHPQVLLPSEVITEELIKNMFDLGGKTVVISYDPLHGQLAKYDVSLTKACKAADVPAAARTAIGLGLPIHMEYLIKLSLLLECGVKDLFYEIDMAEHRRRKQKKQKVEYLTKEFAKVIDSIVVAPSDSYIDSIENPEEELFYGGFYFGPDGVSIDDVEKAMGLVE